MLLLSLHRPGGRVRGVRRRCRGRRVAVRVYPVEPALEGPRVRCRGADAPRHCSALIAVGTRRRRRLRAARPRLLERVLRGQLVRLLALGVAVLVPGAGANEDGGHLRPTSEPERWATWIRYFIMQIDSHFRMRQIQHRTPSTVYPHQGQLSPPLPASQEKQQNL